jgi:hypothetical protein
VVVKPKTAHVKVSVEKPRYKTSKLPPRLAKKKEQMEKERKEAKGFELKIENWDNELANNIPTHSDNMSMSSDSKGNVTYQIHTCNLTFMILGYELNLRIYFQLDRNDEHDAPSIDCTDSKLYDHSE